MAGKGIVRGGGENQGIDCGTAVINYRAKGCDRAVGVVNRDSACYADSRFWFI